MPPTLSRSSIRYLPARVCPNSSSLLVSRATPSEGHNVVVSGYSVPHFGQIFIEELLPHNFLTGRRTSAYHRVQERRKDSLRTNGARSNSSEFKVYFFETQAKD